MRPTASRAALAAFAVMLASAPVAGVELFELSVSDGATAVDAGSHDVVALAEDLFNQRGRFAVFATSASYAGSLAYLGVRDAVRFTASNFGSTVRLDIPSTGTSVVFTGTTPGEIQRQVERWIERDGARAWGKFLGEMNERAPLSLLDGNPRSTTALMATGAFDRFGTGPLGGPGSREKRVGRWGDFEVRARANGSFLDVGHFDRLTTTDAALTLERRLGDAFGLSLTGVGQYRDYDGARSYDVGLELAVPIQLSAPIPGLFFGWTLTPLFQAAGAASRELAAGGLVLGGGAVSTLEAEIGPLGLVVANELVYYGGVPIEGIGGYDFRTEVDQLVLRNGFALVWKPFPLAFVRGGASGTRFLTSDAAVEAWASPFLAVGLHAGPLELALGYEADVGGGYTAHGVGGRLRFRFF